MGIDGPTFVPKSGYFLLIWVKVCPQKLAFLNFFSQFYASINSKREHPPPGVCTYFQPGSRGFVPSELPGGCPGVARVSDLLSKYQVVS